MRGIEERRQAIIQEILSLLPKQVMKQPWQFTAGEVAERSGQRYAKVMDHLQALVAQGVLKSEPDGFNPETGRRTTLFWRPEDEPASCLGACGNDG